MRLVVAIGALTFLAGCASNQYSNVPEPTGEWVPANPPGLVAETAPATQAPARALWPPRRPAARLKAAAQ